MFIKGKYFIPSIFLIFLPRYDIGQNEVENKHRMCRIGFISIQWVLIHKCFKDFRLIRYFDKEYNKRSLNSKSISDKQNLIKAMGRMINIFMCFDGHKWNRINTAIQLKNAIVFKYNLRSPPPEKKHISLLKSLRNI